MGRDIQIVIPMSGIGKRFIDAGYTSPKPLIKVDGKPMIEHVINLFPGEENFFLICNKKHIEEYSIIRKLRKVKSDVRIFQTSNENRMGPVHAVSQIFNEINDNNPVIVSYCDYGTDWDYFEFLAQIKKNNLDGSIATYTGFHPHMLGKDNYAFLREENGLVKEIQEKKPFTNNKMSELASNGTYYFKNGFLLKKYFKMLMETTEPINGEYYVSMVYNLMIADGLKIGYFNIDHMLQWGTPNDLQTYQTWSDYFSKIKREQPKSDKIYNATMILPMAGFGSRFTNDGYCQPKPLITIDGTPMVSKAIDSIPKTKEHIFIVLNEHKKIGLEDVLSKYENSKIIGLDEPTEGQACTCEIGISQGGVDPDSPIIISACDNGVLYDENKFDELVNDSKVDVIVWSFRNNQTSNLNPNMYAWLDVDCDDYIKYVSCKKFVYDDPLKTHAIIGTMYFKKSKYFTDNFKLNLEKNLRINNEFYVDDVINRCIQNGLKVKVFEAENYICWGTPDDLKTYNYWKEYFDKIS